MNVLKSLTSACFLKIVASFLATGGVYTEFLTYGVTALAQETGTAASESMDSLKSMAISGARAGDRAMQVARYDLAIRSYRQSLSYGHNGWVANNLSRAYLLNSEHRASLAKEALSEGAEAEASQLEKQSRSDRAAAIAITSSLLESKDPVVRGYALLTQHEAGEPVSQEKFFSVLDEARNWDSPHLPYLFLRVGKNLGVPSLIREAIGVAEVGGNVGAQALAHLEFGLASSAVDPSTAGSHFVRAALLTQTDRDNTVAYRALYQLYLISGDFAALSEAVRALDRYREFSIPYDSLVNFEKSIEPVYREYLKQLLDRQDYTEALQVADRLLIAEVEAYLAADCFYEPSEPIAGTVLRYLVSDSTLWIFVLRDGELQRVERVEISASELKEKARSFRDRVVNVGQGRIYLLQAQELYELLIAPVADDLGDGRLTIVADRGLRRIPFAALHNGRGYLVERKSLVKGLQITVRSHSLRPQLDGFFLGVGESVAGLSPLPSVADAAQLVRLEASVDREASYARLKKVLASQPTVLHLATHAYYGSLDRSWIQLYDRRVTGREFESLLRTSNIGLLVLAGCDTATGDEISALGLSSLAISTGADRVLGTLWAFHDREATAIMPAFYNALRSGLTPEAALQSVQVQAIDNGIHPSFWASLILVD